MKHRSLITALLASSAMLAAAPAFAGNKTVENALKNRPELSSFYQGMINTGVLDELDPNTTYSIFAPTNTAMERISPEKYPCFYSQQCVEEVADIMRNHIVEGPVLFGHGSMPSAAYSVDHTHITFGNRSASRNNTRVSNVTVNGARITRNSAMGAGQLYNISGVIANPQEMADVTQYKYVEVEAPRVVLVPVPTHTVVTTKQVFYAPDGSPNGISQTVTEQPTSGTY
ncbi:MAG: fasciclin domain-containing protein [Rickettsiales bacterium]